jgi:transposase-like protein
MRPQRRTYSKSFKAQVIQECSEPGASIANIALGYSLNAALLNKSTFAELKDRSASPDNDRSARQSKSSKSPTGPPTIKPSSTVAP